MTQLENLKNQIKELEKSCDEARDRIKNENLREHPKVCVNLQTDVR